MRPFTETGVRPAGSPSLLREIVAVLGGDLYDQGRRASIPAPGHSAHDRSVSLWLTGGRLLIHCFGDGDWRAVADDLRRRGLTDGRIPPAAAAPAPDRRADRARVRAAQALWAAAGAAGPGSLAARHARNRAIARPLASIPDLRSHPAAPVSVYRPGPARRPALLAAVRAPDGEITAVEVTYLEPPGRRASGLRLSRKTVGRLAAGAAVRLDPPGPVLVVAEGVFSALSAGERFGLPAWALLSIGNLWRWTPPAGVGRVIVAGDRGAEGEASAASLAARLAALGLRVSVRLPPPPFGDWNEAAAAGG